MCKNKTIQELLLAYLELALDANDLQHVEQHLNMCEDCRTELALLRSMVEDRVPDPGEAFWNAVPGRVYRAMRDEQARKKHFDFSWLLGRIALPRWVLTAATAGLVLTITWFAFQSPQTAIPTFLTGVYDYADDSTTAGPLLLSELNQDELDNVALWAGKEFASISQEVAPLMAAATDTDIYDELGDLNSHEAEQFVSMLDQWKEEA